MSRPLCIDLFCGLGGWTQGFLAEDYEVVGFDVEQHVYGEERYPAQLVLQDVRTIHGKQFKDATIIVASSPCQEFSYRAMPWKRAKALGPPFLGMELFSQAGRIQREASGAAGRHIPMIQENVRGAQKYVGKAQWHYGSYYLWGDVPALMPITKRGVKVGGFSWSDFGKPDYIGKGFNHEAERATRALEGSKGIPHRTAGHWTNPAEHEGTKQPGISGKRANGKGDRWFQDGAASVGGKSSARKAASARIAKIPFPLAQYIARTFYPEAMRGAA